MPLGWSHATFTDLHVAQERRSGARRRAHRRRLCPARHLPGRQAPLRFRRDRGRPADADAGAACRRVVQLQPRRHIVVAAGRDRRPQPNRCCSARASATARSRSSTRRRSNRILPNSRSSTSRSMRRCSQTRARSPASTARWSAGARKARRFERWPLSVRSVIDYTRGFAMHRFRAPELPLRGLLNFLVHAPIARFDDGVMRNVDVRAYALDIVRRHAVRVPARRRRHARRRADHARPVGPAGARSARCRRPVRRRRDGARSARRRRRHSDPDARRNVRLQRRALPPRDRGRSATRAIAQRSSPFCTTSRCADRCTSKRS